MERMVTHMGLKVKWLDFSDPKYYEQSILYQTFPVCESCTVLYKALRELKTVEIQIAQAFGITQKSEFNDIIERSEIEGLSGKTTTRSHQSKIIEKVVPELNYSTEQPNKELSLINNRPIDPITNNEITELRRYRFIIAIYELQELELFSNVKTMASQNASFYITYKLLDQNVRYKINLSH